MKRKSYGLVRKKGRRTKKRKNFKKKYSTKLSRVPLAHMPLGQGQLMKFRYADYFTIDTGVSGVGAYTYRLNSLFDPDFSSLGHQPLGFDNIMGTGAANGIFKEYQVLSCAFNIKTASKTVQDQSIVIAYLTDNVNAPISQQYATLIENGGCKYKLLPGIGSGSMTEWYRMNGKVSIKKYFKEKVLDSTYTGYRTSGPQKELYLHILLYPQQGGVTNVKANFQITLNFIALCRNPSTQDRN